MTVAIAVEQLSKVYGSTPAIRDVTFEVETGEILGFLGPNGAGKTTTMRILAGYIPATTGTARIEGFDVHDDSLQARKRIGYLPETPPLYPDMTVEGFLFFVARIKGISAGDRAAKVATAIHRCGLDDRRRQAIRKLSKGYRQRVGIAQAIVHEPPAIILDEPTVGLDPRQIIEVRELIKSLAGDRTVLLSTHILPEVSMTCSRVTIIANGTVVATDTTENLAARAAAGSGYDLEVAGDLDRVLPALRALPGVDTIDAQPLADRWYLRAVCTPEREVGNDLAAAIVGGGLELYELRRSRASLEQVFLQLTTQESLTATEAFPAASGSDEPTRALSATEPPAESDTSET